ncbi:MAG TPA: DUF3800 domain-containing protein [Anaerolineae bacterium]|nr:DUF3800 domain-containing protein [Anaerolineae bacterium]
MTTFYAGDEAGDVSFSFAKGASRYFVVAVIATDDPDQLRDALARLKAERNLPEAYEFSFHGTTSRALKEAFFAALKPLPFTVSAVVVDKQTLPDSFKVMGKRSFYVFFVSELIRSIPQADRTAGILMLDEFDRAGKTIADLKKALKVRGIPRGFKKIGAKRSRGESLIQCADMIAGAIFRKYTRGDDSFFRMVEGKVSLLLEYRGKNHPASLSISPSRPPQSATLRWVAKTFRFILHLYYTPLASCCQIQRQG